MPENINDKGYRRMLSDKRNFRDFVKHHIAAPWADRLDADCLERIDARFVTKDFKDRESDIIYRAKIEDSDVVFYVLLELQSEPDFTMPFRLLVYMTELMRRLFAEEDKKVRERKDFRLPAVIPMILYNGSGKWSCVKSFKEYLKQHKLFVPNVIDFTYILINVNEPDEAELLKTPTLVNLAMLADRKGKPERVLHRLSEILELSRRLTADERLQLKDWIFDVIVRKAGGVINEDTVAHIGKAFEGEEESDMMTYAIERAIDEIEQRGIRKGIREGKQEGIREGKQEGIREGKQEGIREGILEGEYTGMRKGKMETAIAMLSDGLSLETASKYSGISVDELRQEMGSRKSE